MIEGCGYAILLQMHYIQRLLYTVCWRGIRCSDTLPTVTTSVPRKCARKARFLRYYWRAKFKKSKLNGLVIGVQFLKKKNQQASTTFNFILIFGYFIEETTKSLFISI